MNYLLHHFNIHINFSVFFIILIDNTQSGAKANCTPHSIIQWPHQELYLYNVVYILLDAVQFFQRVWLRSKGSMYINIFLDNITVLHNNIIAGSVLFRVRSFGAGFRSFALKSSLNIRILMLRALSFPVFRFIYSSISSTTSTKYP